MGNCKLSIYFNPLKKQEPENACKLVAARAGKSHVCITYPHPLHCGYYWKLLEFHIGGTEANNILKSKNPGFFRNRGSGMVSLTMSYFHWKYNQLSSAIRCFTVLFGMGRSGTTSLWSSGKGFAARAANSLLGQKQS